MNVKTFWILFMMNKIAKYIYMTEFDTRVFFSRLCLLMEWEGWIGKYLVCGELEAQ